MLHLSDKLICTLLVTVMAICSMLLIVTQAEGEDPGIGADSEVYESFAPVSSSSASSSVSSSTSSKPDVSSSTSSGGTSSSRPDSTPESSKPSVSSSVSRPESETSSQSQSHTSSQTSSHVQSSSSSRAPSSSSSAQSTTSQSGTSSRNQGGTTTSQQQTSSSSSSRTSSSSRVSSRDESSSVAESSEESQVASKNITDVGAIAQKWIFLPILTALASIAVLVVVNVRAAKQRRMERAAQARLTRRRLSPADVPDDGYDIFSDSANERPKPRHSAPPRNRRNDRRSNFKR